MPVVCLSINVFDWQSFQISLWTLPFALLVHFLNKSSHRGSFGKQSEVMCVQPISKNEHFFCPAVPPVSTRGSVHRDNLQVNEAQLAAVDWEVVKPAQLLWFVIQEKLIYQLLSEGNFTCQMLWQRGNTTCQNLSKLHVLTSPRVPAKVYMNAGQTKVTIHRECQQHYKSPALTFRVNNASSSLGMCEWRFNSLYISIKKALRESFSLSILQCTEAYYCIFGLNNWPRRWRGRQREMDERYLIWLLWHRFRWVFSVYSVTIDSWKLF